MNFIENIIRGVARRVGWEIGSKIENAVWSVAIGLFLMCCCLFSCVAVFWKVTANSVFH